MLYSCVIALVLAYEPIDTNVVVAKDDYSEYDNCGDPGNCAAPCLSPQTFHVRMCESWMCTQCSSEWCAESCKKLQADYPTCRCKDWRDGKNTYSVSDIPPVPEPTCKDGNLVGCHTFWQSGGSHYYYAVEFCPSSVRSVNPTNTYYWDMTFGQPITVENGMLTYEEFYYYHAPEYGSYIKHYKFECDESEVTKNIRRKNTGEVSHGVRVGRETAENGKDQILTYKGPCAC